jgi:hypothetical protein
MNPLLGTVFLALLLGKATLNQIEKVIKYLIAYFNLKMIPNITNLITSVNQFMSVIILLSSGYLGKTNPFTL